MLRTMTDYSLMVRRMYGGYGDTMAAASRIVARQLRNGAANGGKARELYFDALRDTRIIRACATHEAALNAAHEAAQIEADMPTEVGRQREHAENAVIRRDAVTAHEAALGGTLSDAADLMQEAAIVLWRCGYGEKVYNAETEAGLHTVYGRMLYRHLCAYHDDYAIRAAYRVVGRTIRASSRAAMASTHTDIAEYAAPCTVRRDGEEPVTVEAVQRVTHTVPIATTVTWASDYDMILPAHYDISTYAEWSYIRDVIAAMGLQPIDNLYLSRRMAGDSRIAATDYVWGGRDAAARHKADKAVQRIRRAYVDAITGGKVPRPLREAKVAALRERIAAAPITHGNADGKPSAATLEQYRALHAARDYSHIRGVSCGLDISVHAPTPTDYADSPVIAAYRAEVADMAARLKHAVMNPDVYSPANITILRMIDADKTRRIIAALQE